MKNIKFIFLLTLLCLFSSFSFAKNFYPGIRFAPTFTTGIGGTDISSHDLGIGFEAGLTFGIKLSDYIMFSTGCDYTQKTYNYKSENSNYGSGLCTISFPSIQIPLLLDFTINNAFRTKGTFGIYGGEKVCFIIDNQQYTNSSGSFVGNFLLPTINISLLLGAEFFYPIGPVQLGFDFCCMLDLLENELNYRGNVFTTGRLLYFIPSVSVRIPF